MLVLLTTAVLAGSALVPAGALATPAAKASLSTSLVPSVPSEPMLHGVKAGGAPWVLKQGTFRLLGNGQVVVIIRGLVIPELGTPGPVKTVAASLYCGNETTAAATTASVPISEAGDAMIVGRVSLPASCQTPAVLINPNGIGSIYITTSGFANSETGPLLSTSLTPSVPSEPMLHGVKAGGAPWVLRQGTFQLLGNGQVVVIIRGLVIPELGTPGPVKTVAASLYCGNETTAAAMTASVPISEAGDAMIVDRVSLPASCQTPAVLINPNGIGSIYITTSGFPV
jgi:hypothetical protein